MMTGTCNCCGRNLDLRLGFCFDCAEMESVIADGTDMRDNPVPHTDGFSSHMDKLKYILDKTKNWERVKKQGVSYTYQQNMHRNYTFNRGRGTEQQQQ